MRQHHTTTLLLLSALVTCCTSKSELFRRAEILAGPGARECGHVAADQDTGSSMACAQQAITDGAAFRVSFDTYGIDSALTLALVGSTSGGLTELRFDSDTAGGSQFLPHPHLFERDCPGVSFEKGKVTGRSLFRCLEPAAATKP
jgi:hypothetical protein